MVMVSLTAPLTLSTQLRASTQGLSRRASTSVPRPARPATAAALSGAVTNSAAYRVARLARKAAVSGANGDSLVREVKKAVKAAEVTPSPNAEKTGSWTIGEVHHKFRLDRTLKVLLGGASEKFIDRALRAGCVTHNGRVVRVNQGKEIYLKQGDLVKLRKLAPSSLHELPDAEWRTRLIYEDAHIMVIDKPSGLSSAPTPSEPYNAVNALEEFLARRDGKPTTLRNVHRLDKETSGVLIMAKSAAVAGALGATFKGNLVQKCYWAVLEGKLEGADSGLWSDRHDVDSNGHAFILPADAPEGKTAKTKFQVLERLPEGTVVELRPTTGRMHQLRAQSRFRRAPVAGDNRYGEPGARSAKAPRLCLHCVSLSLPHPTEAERTLELSAPVPDELSVFVERLRNGGEAGPGREGLLPHEEVLSRATAASAGVEDREEEEGRKAPRPPRARTAAPKPAAEKRGSVWASLGKLVRGVQEH